MCRSVYAEFAGETKVKGIPTWRFSAGRDLLDYNVNKNLCFCPGFDKCLEKRGDDIDEWDRSKCTEDEICMNGLLHAKGCYGAPLVLSQPHFFLCNESIINDIDGMEPNENEHDSYLDSKILNMVKL